MVYMCVCHPNVLTSVRLAQAHSIIIPYAGEVPCFFLFFNQDNIVNWVNMRYLLREILEHFNNKSNDLTNNAYKYNLLLFIRGNWRTASSIKLNQVFPNFNNWRTASSIKLNQVYPNFNNWRTASSIKLNQVFPIFNTSFCFLV